MLDLAYTWTTIRGQIERASDVDSLRLIYEQMKATAHRWREREMPKREILTSLNGWHDLLIRRVIELALVALEAAGHGTPPCPFCWLLLGSGGRQEQTLHVDQDNALLYQDGSYDEMTAVQVAIYFQKLAERVVTDLAVVGYPFCQGYVMATNTRWNLSLSGWQELLTSYTLLPNWEHARFLMIAADHRPVYGDRRLAESLSQWFGEMMQSQHFLHWQVADHGMAHELGLDAFQRLRVESWGAHEGELNVKERGYLQLINAVRLWAIACGVGNGVSSTSERIRQLHEAQVWDADVAQEVRAAFDVLVWHRLWSNYVRPDALSSADRDALKAALQTVKRLQKRTFKRFRKPK
jgi:CBS domain-containing protein